MSWGFSPISSGGAMPADWPEAEGGLQMSIVRTDQRIRPDGHRRRPPRRLTRKGKACALCDAGHHADGPRGHHVDGKWKPCQNQAQPEARKAPTAAADARYDRIVRRKQQHKQRQTPALPLLRPA